MRSLWGYREQGRLHPADLELIALTVVEAVRKELVDFMSQLSDLMDGLTQLTSDVANEMSAHAAEVADLQSKLQAAQDAANANQPVDLGPALDQVNQLRQKFEQTASNASQASDAASDASDVVSSSDTAVSPADGSVPGDSPAPVDDGSQPTPPDDGSVQP